MSEKRGRCKDCVDWHCVKGDQGECEATVTTYTTAMRNDTCSHWQAKQELIRDSVREQLARHLYYRPVSYCGNTVYERCLDQADEILAIVKGGKDE